MALPSRGPQSRLLRHFGGLLARARFHHNAEATLEERHLVSIGHAFIDVANWGTGTALQQEDVELGLVVRRAVTAMLSATTAPRVRFRVDESTLDTGPPVRANRGLLDELLSALLLHAVESCQPGDTVTLRSIAVGDQVWLRLEYSDASRHPPITLSFARGRRGPEGSAADRATATGAASPDAAS